MNRFSTIFLCSCSLFAALFPLRSVAQSCENRGLDFDGVDDWVQLNPIPLTTNSDFTIEAWFTSTTNDPTTNCDAFRRLFSLAGSGTDLQFGECGGLLHIVYRTTATFSQIEEISTNNIRDGQWHCVSVVRSGNNLIVYLDNNQVWTQAFTGVFNFSYFRLGLWPGPVSANSLWTGMIDEVRIWSRGLTAGEISDQKYCLLSGNESGLLAYWRMDQGIPGDDNTATPTLLDATGNGNEGVINNFDLNGPISNFLCSAAGLTYPNYHELDLAIRDLATRTTALNMICNGDPVHFCLRFPDGSTPTLVSGATIQWEFRDDGGAWITETNPAFLGLCFPLLPGELIIDCSSSVDGLVQREYRAVITLTDPQNGSTCTYSTDPYLLTICCPIQPVSVNLTPSDPLCEGESATVSVSLTSPDLFVSNPGPFTSIEWFFNGNPIPFTDQTGFTYSFTVPMVSQPTEYSFSAEISHCGLKTQTYYSNPITVDPEPVCGSILGLANPPNLDLISNVPSLVYEICPGDDASLGEDPMDIFEDCTQQWQFSFDGVSWSNLGFSNSIQNTNILPSASWPGSSIFYRIQCLPLSDPSGCDPCESNIIEIRLKEAPVVDQIVGDNQICDGEVTILSLSSPSASLDYTWYWNGLIIGTGSSIVANEEGNYWVEISNGCQVTETPWFFLQVCEISPVISCPLAPNPCAEAGVPITLSACLSESNCGSLDFLWEWEDDSGMPQTATGCELMDIPSNTGTTYELTITEPVSGCSSTVSRTIIPCLKF